MKMQGKCIHPKQPVIYREKTELPWVGFEPTTCTCTCVYMCSHLLVSLEDIASESTVGKFSSDVAEDLHVLGVVGYVEYPAGEQQ